ncbi:MAG TPA: GspH/FimT family pseudopilin [Ramlibacter sp.]|uniref:GspH/FimT family pseudopilin n=1 Tax=Ramlibacter sp. TaxID=1917967 RepID=UPI002D7EDC67|nr:GspH/FimT family pseudopilin [Ramlibacter sp.]HET8744147.1 GspH/FimT family pseudopilin [Ramlibacter sp.]
MAERMKNCAPGRGAKARSAGFTLIELMVVVTVAAILAGIAAPSFRELMAAQRVRAATSDLYLALVKARSEAIKRNGEVTIRPMHVDWDDGWKIVNPEDPAGPELQVQTAPASVSIAATSGLGEIVYNGSGRTTLAPGGDRKFVITAPNTSLSRCVLVDNSGRPYVKEGSVC